MDKLFIPVSSEQNGLLLSQKIALLQPIPNEANFAEVFKHCNDDLWVMGFWDDEYQIVPNADQHLFDDILTPLLGRYVTQEEIDDLSNAIDLHRGRMARIFLYFPTFWRDRAMTIEQLREDGWFVQQDLSLTES